MWNKIAACKDLAERDALAEHTIHKNKLLTIKSRINNRPPKPMPHLMKKGKKKLEESKALQEIHHHNQLLLEKLEKVKGNVKRATQVLGNHKSGKVTRVKFDEILKIDGENNRILDRIQSAKTHYSARKHKQDYLFSRYLSEKLSENARRIPRVASFNPAEIDEMVKSQRTSRPMTSAEGQRSNKILRPMSAKMIKEGL